MKKNFKYAMLGAIALTGAMGFTACSTDDDVVKEENKSKDSPGKNEVTTQFVFNVSNGNDATTRQSAAATQALSTNQFRGIEDSYILCAKNAAGDGKYLTAAATVDKAISMARVAAAGTLDNNKSRRVLEMSLPLNTNTMLFYGRAIKGEDTHAAHNTYGHLDDYTVDADLSTVNFQLAKRLESATEKTKFQETQKLLAAVLSCVLNTNRGEAAVTATDAPAEGIDPYGFDVPATLKPNMTWSEYSELQSPVDNGTARQLEIKLAKCYKELTTVQDAELRNASGYAVKEMIKNLWSIVNSVRCAEPTDQAEALAKYMAQRIHQELGNYFEASSVPTNGGSVTGVTIKSASTLINELGTDTYWPTATAGTKPAATAFSNISGYTSENLGQFPEQFDLPQGSTHIKFDNTAKTFYYVENYNSSAVGGNPFTVDDYYYPAELLYFGNSPLRVSDKEHVETDYPISVSLWNTETTANWPSDWSVGHVLSSTRSVAMKNDINYGTSLLKTTVSYNVTSLKDNNKAIQERDYGVTEDDKTINVDGTSFKLVGILVGDQWPKVGWNFLPKTTDPGNANYRRGYVYDKNITNNGAIPASGTSEPNYTAVFDNYIDMTSTDTQNKQPKVYIALELQNNSGEDFFGKDNLITKGSNFYLIGELDPTGKEGPVLPAYHALPPYDQTQYGDDTRTVPRVFIQDHMTTANFKIGTNSLKYAYLTVPDLRSSSVTLGLSVDLEWSTGLDFGNVLLGGE
jgi:hypothetical protein